MGRKKGARSKSVKSYCVELVEYVRKKIKGNSDKKCQNSKSIDIIEKAQNRTTISCHCVKN